MCYYVDEDFYLGLCHPTGLSLNEPLKYIVSVGRMSLGTTTKP
jgi:hypothetical protein